MSSLDSLLRERDEALARYNAWEGQQVRCAEQDLSSRLAWLEEAYELALRFGAFYPLPGSEADWRRAVSGVGLMHERLAKLKR